VQVTPSIIAGKTACTRAPTAIVGPALAAITVKPMVWPSCTCVEALLSTVTMRSVLPAAEAAPAERRAARQRTFRMSPHGWAPRRRTLPRAAAQHARRHAGGDRQIRDVGRHHRAGADLRALPDGDAG